MRLVVVGAGIVGAAIASRAARRATAVTVLDAGRSPGASNATGSSFAWIGAWGQWPGGMMALRGGALPQWHQLQDELAGVHVQWTGSLSWRDQPHTQPDVTRTDDGSEVLTAAEVAVVEVAVVEPNLREPPARAVWHPGDGAVDPLAVTTALLQSACGNGAQVRLGVRATGLRTRGTRVVGVETSVGFMPADTVVVAAGTGVPRLCEPFGVPVPVTASAAVLLRFDAPRGLVKALIDGPSLEVRQNRSGQLLVPAACGTDVSEEALAGIARRSAQKIRATFHHAADIRLDRISVGQRPMPADGAPIIGPIPGVQGLYLAVMHSGVTLAPLIGRLVVQELIGGVESSELVGCRPARFTTAS